MGDSENKEVVLNEVKADKPEAEKKHLLRKLTNRQKINLLRKKVVFSVH